MSNNINDTKSFGDSRRVLLDVIQGIRDGSISNEQGKAIAQCMSVLNTNVQTEINYTKTAIFARDKGHDFGRVAKMGSLIIDGAND